LQVAAELIAHNIRARRRAFHRQRAGCASAACYLLDAEGRGRGIAAASPTTSRRAPPSCDFAIFYRVNALSRAFEFALRERGVPYQMVNGLEFFQRREIKDISRTCTC